MLVYLLFLVILGLPVMVMEFAVGRASQRSIAKSFQVHQHHHHKEEAEHHHLVDLLHPVLEPPGADQHPDDHYHPSPATTC